MFAVKSDGDDTTRELVIARRAPDSPRPVRGSVPPTPSAAPESDGGFVAAGEVGRGSIPTSGAGTRLMWHPRKYALRAGYVSGRHWDDPQVGFGSVASGANSVASSTAAFAHGQHASATGRFSTAFGCLAAASGSSSVAAGSNVAARGDASVALGANTVATGVGAVAGGIESVAEGKTALAVGTRVTAAGDASVALGADADAQGVGSIALGRHLLVSGAEAAAVGSRLVVSGEGSVALGHRAGTSADGRGSFVFGDRSGDAIALQAEAPNQFLVRAAGGATVFSNPRLDAGVTLAPGGSSWASMSDVATREHFRDLDGGDVLAKLASMPIREWSYRAQDAAIRHVGPTAQDFHAAFGLGEDPLRISTVDAEGIALAAVKALEARTRNQHQNLARENAALKVQLTALMSRLEALEAR